MSGLGGLNKSRTGVVIGLVQLQLPEVATPGQLQAQTLRVCQLVAKARRQSPGYGSGGFSRILPARSLDEN